MHGRHHRDQQHPVHRRHVDLADFLLGGVANQHARQIAQLHRLAGDRERARYHRLRGDDGGGRGEHHERVKRPAGGQQKERVLDRARVCEQQRALPEIIQQQRREHKAHPGATDRRAPEMPHIGIERLGPGHRQNDRAQQDKPVPGMVQHQIDRVARVDGQQDRRAARDLDPAEDPDHGEPQDHDRAEITADQTCPAPLNDEQDATSSSKVSGTT